MLKRMCEFIMINRFAIDNTQSLYDVLIELLKIPAPSHSEHKRAEYCKKIFESYLLRILFYLYFILLS